MLRRLLLAQESGLVAVIILLMICLTVFGGQKPKRILDEATGEWQVTQVNKFLDAQNLVLLAKDASFIAVMAVGMTGVIVMGGIDLSVGSIYAITALVGGLFLRYNWSQGPPSVTLRSHAWPVWALLIAGCGLLLTAATTARSAASGRTKGMSIKVLSILATITGAFCVGWVINLVIIGVRDAQTTPSDLPLWSSLLIGVGSCCLLGALCGLANGCLIVGLKVHPFIITLGMMAVLRGASFVLTKGLPVSGFPDSFTSGFFKHGLFESGAMKSAFGTVYPVPVIIMIVVAACGAFILSRTVFGRRVYAIGGNEVAAKYAGIPVGRVKIITYVLMGALAGLSASMYLGYLGAGSSDAGQGYELSVIAAAVIGGASLSGGRGSATGAVLGAVLIQLINNAMIILQIDTNYTNIVMGAAIVVAVVLDQTKTRLLPGTR